MKRMVTRLGVVGLLAGGLVAASAGAALAKSDVRLHADHAKARVGETVRFDGLAGDDAGIKPAVFCLQERVAAHRWAPAGHCVRSHKVDRWFAVFRLSARMTAKGHHEYRAVGLDQTTQVARYGPSTPVAVTVR